MEAGVSIHHSRELLETRSKVLGRLVVLGKIRRPAPYLLQSVSAYVTYMFTIDSSHKKLVVMPLKACQTLLRVVGVSFGRRGEGGASQLSSLTTISTVRSSTLRAENVILTKSMAVWKSQFDVALNKYHSGHALNRASRVC